MTCLELPVAMIASGEASPADEWREWPLPFPAVLNLLEKAAGSKWLNLLKPTDRFGCMASVKKLF